MAFYSSGFTRASSLGPIADFLDRQGASAIRILREVDLPPALLERPEIVIPLQEQFRFLEHAARRTGDPYFGARLGQVVRMKDLSAFGVWVCAAETPWQAFKRGSAALPRMLQTSTVLTFARRGATALFSIEFLAPETDGRHHNELLGISYLIDTVRNYAGRSWRPDVVLTALPAATPRAELENIFGTNVSNGHAVTSIEFDAALLTCRRPASASMTGGDARAEPDMPGAEDTLATVAALADLALYEGHPRIEWIATKLGTTPRSLQRLLGAHGTTFNGMVGASMQRRAKLRLDAGKASITDIALELGYSDPAHFTRAFRRWTGVSPSAYRNRTV